ncbi:unnamed protein product [Nyctereutes procyonoides]|uniref:RNA transcription, translation and transport factor protein n=1 Tax=Nyctereutes procyonoides TaxID=34880 RepID=A0A811Z7U3_NYCPR|nr:unnamed protein product [Nyctereutes procyonoides]
MFRCKLMALNYHNLAGFNCKDETEFRNFIVWLEDQKIRHYKIEERGDLRNIHSSDWPKFFEKYLRDVNSKDAELFINLDVNNPDFKAGRPDDYLVMRKAIHILVQECLTQDAVAKANQTKEGLPVAIDKHSLGFDTGDAVHNETAQILQLLNIAQRAAEKKNNEAIVAVQAIIADPKTNHRLEKV